MRRTRTIKSFGRPISLLIILPTAIAAAEPGAHQPAHVPDLLCAGAVKAVEAAMAKTMARGSPGMIVEIAQGDRTLLSRSRGFADLEQNIPVQRHSVFQLASITKMFTAAAILTLVEQRRLSLDDPLHKHVGEMPRAATGVRINDLLAQTSGIPDYSEDPELFKSRSVSRSTDEMVGLIARKSGTLNFPPGSRWEYSNSNYVLLGAIAERVTGEQLGHIMQRRLFEPAGLATIRFDDPSDIVRHRVKGYRRDRTREAGFANAHWISPTVPAAAGSLRGTAPDLIRWSNALFGGRLLRSESLRLIVEPGKLADGRTTKFGMPEAWQKGLNSDYGMGLFIKQTVAGTRLGHSGDIDGFSTWMAHYPASGVTIVQMINSESADLNVDAIEAGVFQSGASPCLKAA